MTKGKLVFEEIDPESLERNQTIFLKESPAASDVQRYTTTWLLLLIVMAFIMVGVGGITRLTDSGLSIVEWDLIGGILPPFSQSEWELQFEQYKSIPEFSLVNSAMTIDEFKTIFYWEWGHRLWGRLIGLVWLAGFLTFTLRQKNRGKWTLKLFLVGILIGFQGLVGWLMVRSGLSGEMTDVASYWLAIHLGLAFSLIALMQLYYLTLKKSQADLLSRRRNRDRRLNLLVNFFIFVLIIQVIMGALVAGIDAGKSYNDWPLMAGEIYPSDYFFHHDSLVDFLENPAFVQFNHRVTAYLLLIVVIMTWFASRRSPIPFVRSIYSLLLCLVTVQLVLGIVTVVKGATIEVAILHQLLGLVLWIFTIWVRFETSYPRRYSFA